MMSTVDMPMTQEDFERLCKLRTQARNSENQYLRDADRAKQSKKNMEAAQDQVNKFLDEIAAGPLPLEQQAERNRGGDAAGLFDDGAPADEPGSVPVAEGTDGFDLIPEGELWRAVAIDEIFLPPAVLKKLRGAGIDTIGSLADWSNGGKDLTDIAGIGEETKNAIVDAMIDYFKVNPLPKPQVVENTSGSPESDSPGPGPEDAQGTPSDASQGEPDAFPDPPKGRRRKKSKGEPENGADPTPEEAE